MIPSSRKISASRLGSCRCCSLAIRTAPPAAHTPNRSYTDRSKHSDVTHNSRSPGPTANVRLTQSIRFAVARWPTATPFGSPLEPDVKITYAGRSGSDTGAAAPPSPPPAEPTSTSSMIRPEYAIDPSPQSAGPAPSTPRLSGGCPAPPRPADSNVDRRASLTSIPAAACPSSSRSRPPPGLASATTHRRIGLARSNASASGQYASDTIRSLSPTRSITFAIRAAGQQGSSGT